MEGGGWRRVEGGGGRQRASAGLSGLGLGIRGERSDVAVAAVCFI